MMIFILEILYHSSHAMLDWSNSMIQILTHRGLDPSRKNFFKESSIEAFTDQLSRGYGLEFDLQITKDRKVVVTHDQTLERMSNGVDKRRISEVDSNEILAMDFDGSHLATFDQILALINERQVPAAVSAVHLKSNLQNQEDLDLVLVYITASDVAKFYIFDVTIETAQYLKKHIPSLRLAPSVAHPYDIKRYGDAVGGTLLSIEQVLANKELFDGVWLDEWDLMDQNGATKKFYIQEVVDMFKNIGLWVALVSPELHGISPGLLGGEAHPDAKPFEVLAKRLQEMAYLHPDAVCTDYPDYLRGLISH